VAVQALLTIKMTPTGKRLFVELQRRAELVKCFTSIGIAALDRGMCRRAEDLDEQFVELLCFLRAQFGRIKQEPVACVSIQAHEQFLGKDAGSIVSGGILFGAPDRDRIGTGRIGEVIRVAVEGAAGQGAKSQENRDKCNDEPGREICGPTNNHAPNS
jgi:hypothetical protein